MDASSLCSSLDVGTTSYRTSARKLARRQQCVDTAVAWWQLPVFYFRFTHNPLRQLNFNHEHGKPNVCTWHCLPFATSGFPLPVDPVSSGTSGSLDLFVCCRVCSGFLTFLTMTSNTPAIQKVQSIVTFENLWCRNGTSG